VNGRRLNEIIVFFDGNHVERRVSNLKAGRAQVSGKCDVAPRFGSGEAKIHDVDVVRATDRIFVCRFSQILD